MFYFIPTSEESDIKTLDGQNLYLMVEKDIKSYMKNIYRNRGRKKIYSNIHPELQYILRNFFEYEDIIKDNIDKSTQFIKNFRVTFYDIEVYEPDFRPTHETPTSPIVLISYYCRKTDKLEVIGFQDTDYPIEYYKKFDTELDMLLYFLTIIHDTDVLVGWNNELFDTPYLFARLRFLLRNDDIINSYLPFHRFEFKRKKTKFGEKDVVDIMGVTEYDFIELLKQYDKKLRKYKLDYVAKKIIKREKYKYSGKISDFLKNNFTESVIYNKEDTVLVNEINSKKRHIEKAIIQSYQCIVTPIQHAKPIIKWETNLLKEFMEISKSYADILLKRTTAENVDDLYDNL
jgi:DNA polymerase elongation subunit (family B)